MTPPNGALSRCAAQAYRPAGVICVLRFPQTCKLLHRTGYDLIANRAPLNKWHCGTLIDAQVF
jgi:hypothetical protein